MTVPIFSRSQQKWNPVSIYGTDLVARFRADTGVTLDGSNRVSNWADMTGNGHDLAQTTAGNRPDYYTSGGPNNAPYVASGTTGTNFMTHGGTPVTVNTGNWSTYIIASVQAVTGVIAVFTTTLTTPAGCVALAWRKSASDFPQVQQLGVSVPQAITGSAGNYLPALTFVGGVGMMDSVGTRTLLTAGDGQTQTITDAHTGSIGAQLAEGYIFRFGGSFYQNLAIYEFGFMQRTSTTTDLNKMRDYFRSVGCSVP